MPEAIISAKGTEAPTVRPGRFTRRYASSEHGTSSLLEPKFHGLPQLSAILKLDVLGEHGGCVVFVFDPPCRVVHAQHLSA